MNTSKSFVNSKRLKQCTPGLPVCMQETLDTGCKNAANFRKECTEAGPVFTIRLVKKSLEM